MKKRTGKITFKICQPLTQTAEFSRDVSLPCQLPFKQEGKQFTFSPGCLFILYLLAQIIKHQIPSAMEDLKETKTDKGAMFSKAWGTFTTKHMHPKACVLVENTSHGAGATKCSWHAWLQFRCLFYFLYLCFVCIYCLQKS